MGLQFDHYKAQLGREVVQAGSQVTDRIAELSDMTTRLIAIRDEVMANADGIFDNPMDLNWVNARLIVIRDEIQGYANGLP